MLVQLPDGTAIAKDGTIVPATLNTGVQFHSPLALARLIERWRADSHPNLAALLTSFTGEVQTLESAIWATLVGRLPDYAVGVQLDALGKIVGQIRNGLSDAAYRVHIKARVSINQSFGRPEDIIAVLRLIDTPVFHLVEYPTARFEIWYETPPSTPAIGHELPSLVSQARAAGVNGLVLLPTDPRSAFYGTSYAPTLNATRGYSSSYDPSVGGLWSHGARA